MPENKEQRKYTGAGIGIERMNRILDLLLFGPKTITAIIVDLDICTRAARNYLSTLLGMGKIRKERNTGTDKRMKFYSLVPGSLPIPVPELNWPRRRPLKAEKQKTGPKPKNRPPMALGPHIKTVKAQNLGMSRDPLVAALFG